MRIAVAALLALAPLGAQTLAIPKRHHPHRDPRHHQRVYPGARRQDRGVRRQSADPVRRHVIDAAGQYVIPGIVDAHTHIAADGGVNEAASRIRPWWISRTCSTRGHRPLPRAGRRRNHHTRLARLGNAVGGQCVTIKARWGKDAQGLMFQGRLRASSSLSARTQTLRQSHRPHRHRRRSNGPLSGYPHGRRRHHNARRSPDAKAYQAEWNEYRAKVAEARTPSLRARTCAWTAG